MEITKHLPADVKPHVKSVTLTPGCELFLKKTARELGVLDAGKTLPALATAVGDFLKLPHWSHPWWKEQKVHTFIAFAVTPAGNPEDLVKVIALLHHTDEATWTVMAPGEYELPPDYYEKRLIAEVTVETFPEALS